MSAGGKRAALAAAACLAAAGAFAGVPGREGAIVPLLAGEARGAALGAPAAALAEGSAALFGNPAALALEPGMAFGITHLAWTDGFFGETLTAALPAGHGAAFGVAAFVLVHEAVPLTSELLPDGTGEDAGLLHGTAALASAQSLTESFSAGAALRVIHEQLGTDLTEGLAADLGAVWTISPEFRAGVTVRGLGLLVQPRAVRDPLPASLEASLRVDLSELAVPARAYLGGRLPARGVPAGGIAVEGGEFFGASLRFRLEAREFEGLNWGLGAGFHRDLWRLDYAVAPAGGLGWSHRFGLTVRFARRGRAA